MKTMRLLITTPAEVVIDQADVVSVKADDFSGSFGLQPGHCEFMTALTVSVLTFQTTQGLTRYVALRGGVLNMRAGTSCEIATREAVAGDDLVTLRTQVLRQMVEHADREAAARTETMKLQLSVMRQLNAYLRGERPGVLPFGQTGGGGRGH
ncbi:MAG: F0F1 ATP synthase subunit epsilon [Rhodospirillaceae bacterium]